MFVRNAMHLIKCAHTKCANRFFDLTEKWKWTVSVVRLRIMDPLTCSMLWLPPWISHTGTWWWRCCSLNKLPCCKNTKTHLSVRGASEAHGFCALKAFTLPARVLLVLPESPEETAGDQSRQDQEGRGSESFLVLHLLRFWELFFRRLNQEKLRDLPQSAAAALLMRLSATHQPHPSLLNRLSGASRADESIH